MKKIIISLLLSFLISAFSYTANKIEDTVVSVFSVGAKGVGNCSGVIIEKTDNYCKILTCKHCLSITEEVYAENNQVELILTLPDEDLALLIVKGKIENKEETTIAKLIPILKQQVVLVGYPGFELWKKDGVINKITKDWYWAKLESKGGCSGGGIFNKKKELIGILWGGIPDYKWSVFEPLQDIERFLKKIEEWK